MIWEEGGRGWAVATQRELRYRAGQRMRRSPDNDPEKNRL